MKSFKSKLQALDKAINNWTKEASKSKKTANVKLLKAEYAKFKILSPLLKEAIDNEIKTAEENIDLQINDGFNSNLSVNATINPKYKEIKELQQFLSEDNIRDTNPIIILSFNKLIELTIDYLQNLSGMLNVVGTHSHDEDNISDGIKKAIVSLFTGNDANSYKLNEYIRNYISDKIDELFNSQGAISLSHFCNGLAFGIENDLISYFQKTKKKELKKLYGKKFRKHKKSPYPFISKIITAIELYDLPFDIQGDIQKEKLFSNLATWYSNFLQQLLMFEAETSVDYLKKDVLQKALTGFGDSLSIETTPSICKVNLVDNILNSLGEGNTIKASIVAQQIKPELDNLKNSIQQFIENDSFVGIENIDNFLGIKPKIYFDFIRTALEENHFEEYKKIIKNWTKDVDLLMNELGVDEDNGQYNYKSKDIIQNLSKLFKINHSLIDFKVFIKSILDGIKAKGYSLELSDVDNFFSESIANGVIYSNLINLYNSSIEKGTFNDHFDTLATSLPSTDQIKAAILKAKIDIILNREVKYLNLEWTFDWRTRDNVMAELVDFALDQIQIPDLIRRFGDFLSNEEEIADNLTDYIEWFEISLGTIPYVGEISFSVPLVNFARMLIDTIRATIGENIEALLDSLADIIESAIDGARELLTESLADIGGEIPDSTINLSLPVKLGLGLDSNGKPFAYSFVDPDATPEGVYSIIDESPYELDCIDLYNTIESNIESSKNKKVNSNLKVKFEFNNPGIGLSTDISALFISTGGSIMINEKEVSLLLPLELISEHNGTNVDIRLGGIPNFTLIDELITAGGELNNAPNYEGGTPNLKFKAFK